MKRIRASCGLTHALLLVATGVLTGCVSLLGTYLDGMIYSLDRAVAVPMQIEVSLGNGAIRATDPSTGEQFAGTYVSLTQTEQGAAFGFAFTPQGSSPAWAFGNKTSNLRPTMATLIGDKGTVLDCRLAIQPGRPPRGAGTCTDNRGGRYTLQF